MIIAQKPRPLRTLIAPFAVSFLLCYLAYHAVSGERGALAYIQLSRKLDKAQTELDATRLERITLEQKVKLMRPDSIDLDLLDEQARKVLGVANEDEVMVSRQKE